MCLCVCAHICAWDMCTYKLKVFNNPIVWESLFLVIIRWINRRNWQMLAVVQLGWLRDTDILTFSTTYHACYEPSCGLLSEKDLQSYNELVTHWTEFKICFVEINETRSKIPWVLSLGCCPIKSSGHRVDLMDKTSSPWIMITLTV